MKQAGLEQNFDQRLRNAAANLGLLLTEPAQSQLLRYLHLLGRWNETYNLTAIRDPSNQLVQHIFDSMAAVPSLNKVLCDSAARKIPPRKLSLGTDDAGDTGSATISLRQITDSLQDKPVRQSRPQQVWDLGSGAGLPGLILAILWPHRNIHTVDSVGKKIAFQNQAIADLALRNVTAKQGRIELQVPTIVPELIVCRAFASLSQFARACEMIAGSNTTLVAMKGKVAEAELQELPSNWRITKIERIEVPELDAERHLIMLNRN